VAFLALLVESFLVKVLYLFIYLLATMPRGPLSPPRPPCPYGGTLWHPSSGSIPAEKPTANQEVNDEPR
jgi:hypothetical protein